MNNSSIIKKLLKGDIMKDVLEYTEDELRGMSNEDLLTLLHEAEEKESLFNTSQLVQKTLINSLK